MPIALIKLSKQRKDGRPRLRACWHNPYDRGAKPQYKVHWDLAWLEEWGRQMDGAARAAKLNPQALPAPPAPLWETTTFAELVEVWRKTRLATMEARTVTRYEGLLRNYLLPAFGDDKLAAIDRKAVRTYFATLMRPHAAHGHCAGTPHPATQLRKIQITLSSVLSEGVELGYLEVNAAARARLPKPLPREEMLYLTEDEVDALAGAIDQRYRTLLYTAAYCGLRASELWALRRKDVDLDARKLRVRQALKRTYGRDKPEDAPLFGSPKSGKPRNVPIPQFVAEMLAEHLGTNPLTPAALVFTAPEGGVVRHELFRRRFFDPAVKRAVADGTLQDTKAAFRFHDLRHTAATTWRAHGASLEKLQSWLGHSSLRVTEKYMHQLDGDDDDTVSADIDAGRAERLRARRPLHAVADEAA